MRGVAAKTTRSNTKSRNVFCCRRNACLSRGYVDFSHTVKHKLEQKIHFSNSENRSRIFSLNLGLLFVGMGIGPTLGSVLIHFTGQILSVFYLTTVVHTLYALSVWFIVPESLTKAQRRQSKIKHEEAKSLGHEGRRSLSFWVNRVFPFITPLGVIMPQISASANPLKAKRDWNLTLVAISYGLMMTLIVCSLSQMIIFIRN